MSADDDGKIMMDLGEDMGEVDIMPSIKILSSMGLPIALAHTPSGLALPPESLMKWNQRRGF